MHGQRNIKKFKAPFSTMLRLVFFKLLSVVTEGRFPCIMDDLLVGVFSNYLVDMILFYLSLHLTEV